MIGRILGMLEELLDPRALLALIAVLGFFQVVNRIIDTLTNPPASELFAILNLVFALPAAATAFWFGFKVGERRNSNNE